MFWSLACVPLNPASTAYSTTYYFYQIVILQNAQPEIRCIDRDIPGCYRLVLHISFRSRLDPNLLLNPL